MPEQTVENKLACRLVSEDGQGLPFCGQVTVVPGWVWACLAYGELEWIRTWAEQRGNWVGRELAVCTVRAVLCVCFVGVFCGEMWGGWRDLCSVSLQTSRGSRTPSFPMVTKMHWKESLCSVQYCAPADVSVCKVTRLQASSSCLYLIAVQDVV